MNKQLLLILVFWGISISANAQTGLYFRNWGVDDGLGSNTFSTLEDSNGFIWIGTYQGLNRYDGYQVSPFSGEHILDQRQIAFMAKTNNGKLFVSTEFSGAFLIDPSECIR